MQPLKARKRCNLAVHIQLDACRKLKEGAPPTFTWHPSEMRQAYAICSRLSS